MSELSPETYSGEEVYTISDFLQGISPLLSEKALQRVLKKRNLKSDTPYDELEQREVDLAEAEAYFQLCDLPVGGQTTKDVDGSWSHTEGGWTVSKTNIDTWYKKYAALRELWGEKVLTKSKMHIINF